MVWLLFVFIIIIFVIFLIDDTQGCLTAALGYLFCLFVTGGIVWLSNYYKSPQIDQIEKIPKGRYVFVATRYKCPSSSSNNSFMAIREDSLMPDHDEDCNNCGKTFRFHNYVKTLEEERIEDSFYQAVLETPAE